MNAIESCEMSLLMKELCDPRWDGEDRECSDCGEIVETGDECSFCQGDDDE